MLFSTFDFRDLQSRGNAKPLREHIVGVVPFLDLLQLGVIIAEDDFGGILQAGGGLVRVTDIHGYNILRGQ